MSKNNLNLLKLFPNLPIGTMFQVKIKSDSMIPLFLTGDSVLVKKIEFNRVKTGDVICFYQDLKKSLIIHRVVRKKYLNKRANFNLITKGDSLQENDFNSVTKFFFVGIVVGKAGNDQRNKPINKLLFISAQRFLLRFKLIRELLY